MTADLAQLVGLGRLRARRAARARERGGDRARWCAARAPRAAACASSAPATPSRRSSRPRATSSPSTSGRASRTRTRRRLEATVRAGTKLHALGEALLALGMATANLGDIDVQSVGGALGTGTHGTGRSLPNLSAQVVSLRLVLASGEMVECSAEREPDLWRAARVSFGALGVLVGGALPSAPGLPAPRARSGARASRRASSASPEEIAANRHFEFFWFPARDVVETKALNPTAAEPASLAGRKYERIDWSCADPALGARAEVQRDGVLGARRGGARLRARRRPRACARAGATCSGPSSTGRSRADDAWLSTAHERETVTISIHQDASLPYRELFADLEPIFREHAGRPHWGKVHTLGAAELARPLPALRRLLRAAPAARPARRLPERRPARAARCLSRRPRPGARGSAASRERWYAPRFGSPRSRPAWRNP